MDDKCIMENLLLTTKGVCDLYMHGTIEASTANVHQTFNSALNNALTMQDTIYDKMAAKGNHTYNLPVPLDDESYNFSFSGLKSAVINLNHKAMQRNEEINQEDLAASFQDVVLSVLVNKTIRATKEYGIKQVLMAGGVSANRGLRNAMGEAVGQLDGVELLLPPMSCCTDNAMMIALAAKQMYDLKLFSDLSLGIKPNLDLENESVSGGNQNG